MPHKQLGYLVLINGMVFVDEWIHILQGSLEISHCQAWLTESQAFVCKTSQSKNVLNAKCWYVAKSWYTTTFPIMPNN